MRQPQIQPYVITDVTPDGDGNWNVVLNNDAYLTVCPGDLPKTPKIGDCVRVQLPIVVGYVYDNIEMETAE